jgi:hypothetical protein
LIRSLSASEKRQFSIYIGRIMVNNDSKFLHLFKVLSKQNEYDEEAVLKATNISKQQLSNIKAHLYKQILISLRLTPSQQSLSLQVREQLDFALILYRKGLYKQSLKVLDKVKSIAMHYEEKIIAYEILELEKVIESQYITRSISNRAELLIKQTNELAYLNVISSHLSNLSLELYSTFLKKGYSRSEGEAQAITDYFYTNLPEFDYAKLGFKEKFWLYQAHLWYNFITHNFLACYRYATKWMKLFEDSPHLISIHPVFYLKGNHYLLESLFYLNDVPRFEAALDKLEKILKKSSFPDDDNILALSFIYVYSNKLNLCFMKGQFDKGEALLDDIEAKIKMFRNKIDQHHIMIFYYKIACLHFGNGKYKKCIEVLKKIIDNKSLEMREDLMCFSHLLNLIAHYEAGLDYRLDALIKSTYKILIKLNDLHEVQKDIIKFLKNLPNISPLDIKPEFRKLHKVLEKHEKHPFERRAFLYLDILSWLESNIENVPVADIIAKKYRHTYAIKA